MSAIELPRGPWDVIYADPPWAYRNDGVHGAAARHYATMPVEALCRMDVRSIAAPNSVLFLWASFPTLPDALDVMRAWGYDYKTAAFVWVKLAKQGGVIESTGFYTRSNAEVCFIGVRGKLQRARRDIAQIVLSPRREHSRKPDVVRERIEQLYGPGRRYLELFGRTGAEGWTVWGNQTDAFAEQLRLDESGAEF